MLQFTVFTPTYNRAYRLADLYHSLVRQTDKNFVWLIIDDGSTDNTEELIDTFKLEKKIDIIFIKQPNQGKHIAINNSFNFIETEYFITIDSDDYLLDHAIENCYKIAKNCSEENFAGFSFMNCTDNLPIDFLDYGKFQTLKYDELKISYKGEKSFALKTEIAKKYLFPVYQDEKFCQEAYMLVQIMDNYQILYTDNLLVKGEYLEDGLSQNIYKRLLKNPKYALETLKIKYNSNLFSEQERRTFAINFWDITLKTKVVNPCLQLFSFPLKGTLDYLKYRFNNKL